MSGFCYGLDVGHRHAITSPVSSRTARAMTQPSQPSEASRRQDPTRGHYRVTVRQDPATDSSIEAAGLHGRPRELSRGQGGDTQIIERLAYGDARGYRFGVIATSTTAAT
jgi:hypothetical protein